jgi:hypothetical protein
MDPSMATVMGLELQKLMQSRLRAGQRRVQSLHIYGFWT